MTGNEYQELAMRTNDGNSTNRMLDACSRDWETKNLLNGILDACPRDWKTGDLLNGILGLAGESGEVADIIKKGIFHGKGVDMEHLKKELGDVMWYVALICESCGWKLDDVMQINVDKLKKRYPDGFSEYRANHREEGDI